MPRLSLHWRCGLAKTVLVTVLRAFTFEGAYAAPCPAYLVDIRRHLEPWTLPACAHTSLVTPGKRRGGSGSGGAKATRCFMQPGIGVLLLLYGACTLPCRAFSLQRQNGGCAAA